MDFIRGLVSALALTVWIGSVAVWVSNPTSGWAVFLVGLTSVVCLVWWHQLPDPDNEQKLARDGRGAPPVKKRKNRFLNH